MKKTMAGAKITEVVKASAKAVENFAEKALDTETDKSRNLKANSGDVLMEAAILN